MSEHVTAYFDAIDATPRPEFKDELFAELLEEFQRPASDQEHPAADVIVLESVAPKPRRPRRRLAAGLAAAAAAVAVVVGVVASSGGPAVEDDVGVADEVFSEDAQAAAYLADVAAVNEARDLEFIGLWDQLFDDSEEVLLFSPDLEVREIAAAVPAINEVLATWVTELDAIEPPVEFADDQRTFISDLEALQLQLSGLADLVEAGDIDAALVAFGGVQNIRATYGAGLSVEFARTLPPGLAPIGELATGSPEGEDAEARADYLLEIGQARSVFSLANTQFQRALGSAVPTLERTFAALEEAGVGTPWGQVHARLQAITPPDSLTAGHLALTNGVEALAAVDAQIGDAVRARDAGRFESLNHRLGLLSRELSLRVPAEIAGSFGGPSSWLGSPPADLFLGQYGDDLYAVLQRTAAIMNFDHGLVPSAFGPFVFVPFMPDDAHLAAITSGAPELLTRLRAARGDLNSLTPPASVAADHGAIVAYVDTLVGQQEALIAAAAAEDMPAVDALLAETAPAYCSVADSLGASITPATATMFGEDYRRVCGGLD